MPGSRKEEITDQKQIELKSTDDPEKAAGAVPNGTDSHKKKFFQNGRIDRPGLLNFIKDIRKVIVVQRLFILNAKYDRTRRLL